VLAQTFTDWELLLMDDGSTDGSLDFACSLDDPRILPISDGLQRGLNVRLNQMVALARGRYFFRMDADDIMRPERVESQIEVLEASGADTVVGSAAYRIGQRSEILGRHRIELHRQFSGFKARHSFIHSTVAARTVWFRSNPYSESFIFHRSEDAELWCRTTKHTSFVNVEKPLLYYREGTLSYQNYLGTTLGILALTREYAGTRAEFLYLMTRELTKLWITSAAVGAGCGDLILRHRCLPVAQKEKAAAERDLERMARQPLPLKSSRLLRREPLFAAPAANDCCETT
jgi:glycosyltransferase involved in cell wall biosynthesis